MFATVTTISLNVLDWFSLVSSIASLILAVISIWLAVHFYSKSKEAEKAAAQLLTKLETQTGLINRVTTRMLDKYVTYSTSPKEPDESLLIMAQIVQSSLSQGLPNNNQVSQEDNSEAVVQHLTTLYIVVMYYAAISNAFLQATAPNQISELEDSHKVLLERSSSDYRTSMSWLDQYGTEYISASPAAGFYNEAIDGDFTSEIKDPVELYIAKEQDSQ